MSAPTVLANWIEYSQATPTPFWRMLVVLGHWAHSAAALPALMLFQSTRRGAEGWRLLRSVRSFGLKTCGFFGSAPGWRAFRFLTWQPVFVNFRAGRGVLAWTSSV